MITHLPNTCDLWEEYMKTEHIIRLQRLVIFCLAAALFGAFLPQIRDIEVVAVVVEQHPFFTTERKESGEDLVLVRGAFPEILRQHR